MNSSLHRVIFFSPADCLLRSSVINGKNRHSSLQITPNLFNQLMTVYTVFPPFLDFVHAFGYRLKMGDEFFNTYHCRYHDQDLVISGDGEDCNTQSQTLKGYGYGEFSFLHRIACLYCISTSGYIRSLISFSNSPF